MSFQFHPEANEELISAFAYYEGVERGLGLDFSREVYASIHNAVVYRTLWPEIDPEIGVVWCIDFLTAYCTALNQREYSSLL